jgi:hypothetical protein
MKRTTQTHILWSFSLLTLLVTLLGSALPAPAAPSSSAQPYQVYLPLIAGPGAGPGATSEALIGAALQRGAIDQETALLYYAFAAFRDPRLPEQYRGAASTTTSTILEDAARASERLTPETREVLRGFAVPPDSPGSWEEQQASGGTSPALSAMAASARWETTCKTSTAIKVWYHPYNDGDAATARSICELVDATIWPSLVSLMGRAPLPDGGVPNNGGDSRFDIYLVDANSAVASPLAAFQATPSYMLVNRHGHTRSQLAQLLMQAILMGYDAELDEYVWLRRATVRWASDYVFPGDDAEQVAAPGYLNSTVTPLDDFSRNDDLFVPIQSEGPEFADGVYLWPFYLARALKQPALIRAMWDSSTNPDSLAAVDSVLPGGFQQAWPQFASLNWNREPVDLYNVEDGLAAVAQPRLFEHVQLAGAPSRRYTLPANVKYLAAEYYHFTFPDNSVRSVLFSNPFAPELGGSPHAQVQAIYRTDANTWFTETWTDRRFVPFCRDLLKERVTDLTIIVSNSDWQAKKALEPFQPATLDASNVACRGWQVEAELTHTNSAPNIDQTSVVRTTATYELYREGDQRYHVELYKLAGGTASWAHSGRRWACAGSGTGSYAVADPSLPHTMIVEAYNVGYMPPNSEGSRKYTALGVRARHAQQTTVSYGCPSGGVLVVPIDLAIDMWLQTDRGLDQWQSVDANGQTFHGSLVYNTASEGGEGTMQYRYSWSMTALPPE